MNFKDLNLGTVFKVINHPTIVIRPDRLWLKELPTRARLVSDHPGTRTLTTLELFGATVEVVEPVDAAPIRRLGDMLILKGGEVLLTRLPPVNIVRCTPGEKFTEFVLSGTSFSASETAAMTPDTAVPFSIGRGAQALGRRGSSSMIFTYRGRVYARATCHEVTGKTSRGSYKRFVTVDGVKRLAIAGMLTVPDDGALYDIIQDQFGPG